LARVWLRLRTLVSGPHIVQIAVLGRRGRLDVHPQGTVASAQTSPAEGSACDRSAKTSCRTRSGRHAAWPRSWRSAGGAQRNVKARKVEHARCVDVVCGGVSCTCLANRALPVHVHRISESASGLRIAESIRMHLDSAVHSASRHSDRIHWTSRLVCS
jgi:hypothetical protein